MQKKFTHVKAACFLDISGRIIYQGRQVFSNGATVRLDLSPYRLSPGTYLLRLSGTKTQQVIRVLKQ